MLWCTWRIKDSFLIHIPSMTHSEDENTRCLFVYQTYESMSTYPVSPETNLFTSQRFAKTVGILVCLEAFAKVPEYASLDFLVQAFELYEGSGVEFNRPDQDVAPLPQ